MPEETSRQVARCESLLMRYREVTGTHKEEIRLELLRYVSAGVYVDTQATGLIRSFRVHKTVEENGRFYVLYSHHPSGEPQRISLTKAVRKLAGPKPLKMVSSDVMSI